MSKKTNILLSYAGQDANCRSLLVAATRASGLPVRFVEVSGVVTDPVSRRALCAAKLQECDAVVVLMSPHARIDPVVAIDASAAADHAIPIYGIEVGRARTVRARVRSDLRLESSIVWEWPRVAAFLRWLVRQPSRRVETIAC